MRPGETIAEAARALVGTRFRLHGRDRTSGLDCVGVVVAALQAVSRQIADPADYALRSDDRSRIERMLLQAGLEPGTEERAGDVVLFRAGAAQLHMGVQTDRSFVHADAMLRRVIERPLPWPWPVLGRWLVAGGGD